MRHRRVNPSNEEADLRLYEAFVPDVRFTLSARSLRLGARVRLTATVRPTFAGAAVYFQLVKIGKRFGAPVYTPSKALNAKATLATNSTAARTWKPPAKGTYYLRVWFAGGTKYTLDGTTSASKARLVPHVPNASKALALVVK